MPKLWIDFTALRSRARFEPVLSHYGLTMLGRGPQKTLLCPFHEETEPSCKVNLEKRAFHCFGCNAKGNVLDFVARIAIPIIGLSLTAHTLDLVNDHFQGLLLGRLRPRATPLRAVYDAKELVPCTGALKLGKLLIGINGCRER